jgi:hypothetical protein
MPRDAREVRHQFLLGEIAEEHAASLGRIGGNFERSLERCARLGEQLDRCDAGPEHDRLLEEYRSARAESVRLRRDYSIQRQALGLHDLRYVDEFYPHPRTR